MNENQVWYYLLEGKSLGPVSQGELIQLVLSKTVPPEILIWTPNNQQEWKPLKEIFDLSEELPPPLPAGIGGCSNSSSEVKEISTTGVSTQPHPWRRYFARTLDSTVNGTAMLFALIVVLGAVAPSKLEAFSNLISNPFIEMALTFLIVPFANAAFIGYTKSSLGKLFFGITVCDRDGRAVGYRLALRREFLVWLYGLGCGIPLISLVAASHQHSALIKNRITSWDRDLKLVVNCRPNNALQNVLSSLGVLVIFGMAVALRVASS